MRQFVLLLLLALLTATAATTTEPPPKPGTAPPPATAPTTPPRPATERARAAVGKLKTTLVGELTKAIAEKGVAGAVTVCGDVAGRVKAEVSAPDLQLGRTSSRLRNPKNVAPAWVAPVLKELESAPADKRGPRTVELKDGVGYVEPLVTMPLCVQCHGKVIAPDVQAALAAKYPQDKAVGFVEGDLRGVVWVEIKHAASP